MPSLLMTEDDINIVWMVQGGDSHETAGAILPSDATAAEIETVLMQFLDLLEDFGVLREGMEWSVTVSEQ